MSGHNDHNTVVSSKENPLPQLLSGISGYNTLLEDDFSFAPPPSGSGHQSEFVPGTLPPPLNKKRTQGDIRSVHTLVLGGGPTGLGAAKRLDMIDTELRNCNTGSISWLLLEQNAKCGGSAQSVITPEGFVFDLGGHVLNTKFPLFKHLLDQMALTQSEPRNASELRSAYVSYVYLKGRLVPVPFQ